MASAVPCPRELNPLVSRNVGREALAKALGNYIGYRSATRRYTMSDIEEFAGVKSRVVECVMEAANSPEYRKMDIGDLLSLSAFLGPAFINQWLELSGHGAFELSGQEPLPGVLATPDRVETLEEERKRIIRRLAEIEDVL